MWATPTHLLASLTETKLQAIDRAKIDFRQWLWMFSTKINRLHWLGLWWHNIARLKPFNTH